MPNNPKRPHARRHALIGKKFSAGLTDAEGRELERTTHPLAR